MGGAVRETGAGAQVISVSKDRLVPISVRWSRVVSLFQIAARDHPSRAICDRRMQRRQNCGSGR